jgi:hypothetical protein
MSEKVIVSKEKLTTLSEKIQQKQGTSEKLTLDEMAIAIENLSTGETLEEYDGSWEIADGFTAVFAETYAGTFDYLSFFSLDNGLTWDNANRFVYNKLEMEGVVQIKFKVTYEYVPGYEMYAGGRVVCEELGVDIEATSSNREIITDNFILTQNINVSMGSAA